MADLSNGSGIFQTFSNLGVGVAELGDNRSAKTDANGIGGRTLIVSAVGTSTNDLTQAELDAFVAGVTFGETNGSPAQTDAFTIVGIDGTVDNAAAMFFALQGTGTLQTNAGDYAANVTVTQVAEFIGISG
jgi:hypothetical protein